ncbi:MAG TPA: NlpC/P60 family protein [Candidatus Eisenbacteria bacterium]|nr:NlpC/P60 family protein [Candidatus Eisenbacteria bacterium]
MPKDGFKRSIVYGIPVLAAVLVVAVVAATFLTQADQAEAVFGRVELEEYEELSIVPIEEIEPQIIEKDLVQINRKITSRDLQDLIDKDTGLDLQDQATLDLREMQVDLKENNVPEVLEVSEKDLNDAAKINEALVEKPTDDKSSEEVEEAEEANPIVDHPEGYWINKYISTGLLNIRSTPSFDAEVVGTLEQGDLVTEKAIAYDLWSEVVLADGSTGYVYNYYLTTDYVAPMEEVIPEETVAESVFSEVSGTMYIGVGAANVRAAANTNSEINATIYYGSSVYLLAYGEGWYKLTDDNGYVGYIREDLLRNDPVPLEELEALEDVAENTEASEKAEEAPAPEAPVAPSNSGGFAAASIAAAQVGKPYVYGGAGPSAFDCSGLVQYAVMNAGGYISRTAASQSAAGIAVPFSYGDYSQLAPGDVLLFAFGGSISHSGMYIGDGQFVHAMNPTDGIQINSIYGYWANSLAYVRRVFY